MSEDKRLELPDHASISEDVPIPGEAGILGKVFQGGASEQIMGRVVEDVQDSLPSGKFLGYLTEQAQVLPFSTRLAGQERGPVVERGMDAMPIESDGDFIVGTGLDLWGREGSADQDDSGKHTSGKDDCGDPREVLARFVASHGGASDVVPPWDGFLIYLYRISPSGGYYLGERGKFPCR